MSNVHVIGTGGTIASRADVGGSVVADSADEVLDTTGLDTTVTTEDVLHINSFHLTFADLLKVRAAVAQATQDPNIDGVVITHGTDTMPETARYLEANATLGTKVVVLTGAMQPASMRKSDASFNLGAAVAALNLLEPGVYISMSGRIFPASAVKKDRARGIFEIA